MKRILGLFKTKQDYRNSQGERISADNIIQKQPTFTTTMPTSVTFGQWFNDCDADGKICPSFTIWAKDMNLSTLHTRVEAMDHKDVVLKR